MVFTGLTSSGAVTTNESQIASYMVGNNSSTNGNGLVSAPTNLSALKIPETHNGKPVTKVGDRAFNSVSKIAIVNIGDNIITIGNNAFSQCTGMTKLTIGSIGQNGFNYCSNLKTIIYNNETDIIKEIGNTCGNWTEIEIDRENTKFKVVDNVLYSKDGSKIVKVPSGISGSFAIPEEVTEIGPRAFATCGKITEMNIGNNVNIIGVTSFSHCTGMTKLTIGSGLNSVGFGGFESCRELKTVIIDSSTIASNLSSESSFGKLVNWATIVYTKTTPGSYILNNFSEETSDIDGYKKYVKK